MAISSGRIFFFQAEDGIRDYKVTGVQTCALPISKSPGVILTEGAEFFKSAIVFRNECSVFQIEKTKTNRIDGIPYINDFLTSDRKSTRLNSSHLVISYAVFCLKKKTMSRQDQILAYTLAP